MLTRFDGVCFKCGKTVKAGKGDFQSIGSLSKELKKQHTGKNYHGKWLVRCFSCKGTGNK
jgi:DNA-directed RNA polymerase subunit N (RpoN/RPB10)